REAQGRAEERAAELHLSVHPPGAPHAAQLTTPPNAIHYEDSARWGASCPRQGSSLPPSRFAGPSSSLLPACHSADVRHSRRKVPCPGNSRPVVPSRISRGKRSAG